MTFYARGQLVQNGRRLQIIFCHGLPSILCEEISDSDQPEGNADDRN